MSLSTADYLVDRRRLRKQVTFWRVIAFVVAALAIIGPELMPDVRGRHVLLLDDILDTGHTLSQLTLHIQGLQVASLIVLLLEQRNLPGVGLSTSAAAVGCPYDCQHRY